MHPHTALAPQGHRSSHNGHRRRASRATNRSLRAIRWLEVLRVQHYCAIWGGCRGSLSPAAARGAAEPQAHFLLRYHASLLCVALPVHRRRLHRAQIPLLAPVGYVELGALDECNARFRRARLSRRRGRWQLASGTRHRQARTGLDSALYSPASRASRPVLSIPRAAVCVIIFGPRKRWRRMRRCIELCEARACTGPLVSHHRCPLLRVSGHRSSWPPYGSCWRIVPFLRTGTGQM
jgi:hypothetical protein